MTPSVRLRAVLVGLLLAGAGLAVPAGATAPTTLRGTSGSWTTVTLREDLHLDWPLREVRSLAADRGPYVGFALTGSRAFLTYVAGRHEGRGCAFGPRCQVDDWPQAFNEFTGPVGQDTSGYWLPKGTYRLLLLGAPGARLQLSSTLPFLARVREFPHRGRVELQPLTSTTPPVEDAQPRADGAATFEGSGDAVTGLVWRLDAQDIDSADADICLGSGLPTVPPQTGACEMAGPGSVSEGSYVGYSDCSVSTPVVLCLPSTTEPVSISHGLATVIRGGSHASYDMTVKALKARISGWAFTVRF